MPSLFEDCREHFGTDDLYGVLNLDKNAAEDHLKKAYRKLSLQVHPDRVDEKEKESATKKFQTLAKVYSILSDKEKRLVYDETGELDEENDVQQDRDWMEYWRLLFPPITVQDIKDFEKKYRGSEEEINDLISAYMSSEGDMNTILQTVLCCTDDDEDRFREILTDRIKKKEIPKFDKFKKSKQQKKDRQEKAAQEAKEAEALQEKLGMTSGEDSLRNMIQQRHAARAKEQDSFLASLEARYAPPAKKGKSTSKKKDSTRKK